MNQSGGFKILRKKGNNDDFDRMGSETMEHRNIFDVKVSAEDGSFFFSSSFNVDVDVVRRRWLVFNLIAAGDAEFLVDHVPQDVEDDDDADVFGRNCVSD